MGSERGLCEGHGKRVVNAIKSICRAFGISHACDLI